MAQAKTMRGSALLILVGDGQTPETFAHPCSINSTRGLQFSAETASNNVPDCDDPEAVVWQGNEKRSKGATISGEGTLHTVDVATFWEWFNSPDPRNVRGSMNNVAGADGGSYFAGAFHLTAFEISGTVGEKATCSITLVADGAVTRVANA